MSAGVVSPEVCKEVISLSFPVHLYSSDFLHLMVPRQMTFRQLMVMAHGVRVLYQTLVLGEHFENDFLLKFRF